MLSTEFSTDHCLVSGSFPRRSLSKRTHDVSGGRVLPHPNAIPQPHPKNRPRAREVHRTPHKLVNVPVLDNTAARVGISRLHVDVILGPARHDELVGVPPRHHKGPRLVEAALLHPRDEVLRLADGSRDGVVGVLVNIGSRRGEYCVPGGRDCNSVVELVVSVKFTGL